jgi:hypothetical protein
MVDEGCRVPLQVSDLGGRGGNKMLYQLMKIDLLVQNTIRSVMGGFKVLLEVSDGGRNKNVYQLTKKGNTNF